MKHLLIPIDVGHRTPGYQMIGFQDKDHDTVILAKVEGSHRWYIAAKEPERGMWFRVGDRPDLRPEFLGNIVSSWSTDFPNADYPMLEDWLKKIYDIWPNKG